MVELYIPNFVNALAQGEQAAAAVNERQRQNALSNFYRDNGAALAGGDRNALAKLYEFDPQAAFGVQRQQQQDAQRTAEREQEQAWRMDERQYQRGQDARQNARQDRLDGQANEELRMRVADHQRKVGAEQALQDAAEAERLAKVALGFHQRGDRQGLTDFIVKEGGNPADYQWDQIPTLAQQYLDWSDIMKGMQPAAPMSGPGKVQADINAGYLPQGTPLRGEAPKTVIDMGGNSSAFTEKSDELAATRLGEVVTEGQGAGRLMGDLQALAGLAGQINTGKGAELLNRFGPYAEMAGISIDGLPEMQAYQAIVDRLAPQMRVPGSGATSDFDARQFLSSLPNLSRTSEGNAIINETLQSVQRQKIAAAEIAGQAQRGEFTWQEADRKISALGNPYETFNKMRDKISGGTAQAPQVGELRKGYRFKGGDPADPNSWEKQ